MSTTFTVNQQRAVDDTGHNILVAASAGSGKTTVLIERLIQKILNGASVTNFLIVTFTNAAAQEMRERLEVAIEKRLPAVDAATKRFLQEQLLLLPAANISTIDAYALRLIENYYHVIGLDPQFRLLSDTAERDMLRQDVLAQVLAAFYEEDHEHHADFLALVHNFGQPGQDDALQDIILKLTDFAEARPDGAAWLAQLADNQLDLTTAITQSDLYQQHILPTLTTTITPLLAAVQDAQVLVSGAPELKKTTLALATIQDYLQQVQTMATSAQWDDLRQMLLQPPKVSLETKASKGVADEPELLAILAQAVAVKNQVIGAKSQLKQLTETFFRFTQSQWQTITDASQQLVATLVLVTQTFRTAFTDAKRAAQLVDFPDLGALALEILADTATRETIQSQFDEILVDEYQDINQLQETLLTQVANGHNMYMVGDVKQSIYGFRQAEPSLFTHKYKQFAQADNDDQRIELADNFRSHNNVTAMTNLIFTQLMDEKLGDIAYLGEAKLVPKADYPASVPPVFSVDIITKQAQAAEPTETDETAENFEKRQAQYARLAEKILALRETTIYDRKATPAGMRPVQYGDIAILTRSKAGYIDLVASLRAAGIPVQVEAVGNYFQTMEVYLMLDVLRVIDNPHQDIPLVAVLRSPMFGLTENDLAAIRLADQQHDFWTALTTYATTHPAAQKIVDQFGKWHQLAIQNDLVTLIWTIFDDTAWLDYVAGMPGGGQRQANLHALYAYARTYQNNTNAGLFRFVRYIEQLQQNDGQLGEAPQEADEQAVRVMTIHASKGLEFPIVFIPEFDKAFNTKDLKGKVLLQKNAGIGINYLQPDALVSMPTLQQLVVQQALKRQSWSEEMRLLYVALTRAEQQLHIIGTATVSEAGQSAALQTLWQRAKNTTGQFLGEDLRLTAKSYLDWLILALARTQEPTLEAWLGEGDKPRLLGPETTQTGQLTVNLVPETTLHLPTDNVTPTEVATPNSQDYEAKDFQAAQAMLGYQYPNMAATQTAAYQSVSEMKRLFEDPDRKQMVSLTVAENGQLSPANDLVPENLTLPTFMTDGSQQPSSAAIGTATHLMLQLLDFTVPQTRESLAVLRDQLVANGRMTQPVADLINLEQILHFLATPFAQRVMQHATTLTREATFAMIMPANQIYQGLADSAPVLVHGIIDGYFIDHTTQSITLFDYKTDYIRPDRITEDLAKLVQRYRGQLRLYQQALQQEYPTYTFHDPQLVALSVGRVVSLGVQ